MRLKEERNNYNATNVVRKNYTVPSYPIGGRKKNTKRWCKGVSGRYHDYQITKWRILQGNKPYWPLEDMLSMYWACAQCGKQLNQWINR